MSTNVLVVDDEPKVLSSLSRCFQQADIEFDLCETAKAAVSNLLERKYDCIISDYKMPGMDGLEFLEIASEIASTTPRLLLSGEVDCILLERAINDCKIDKFINKPWSNGDLVETIRETVRRRLESEKQEELIKKTRKQISDAARLQTKKLPQPIEDKDLAVESLFKPLETLSGDFLDFSLNEKHFNFAIFDSAGHGPAAAMEAYALQNRIDVKDAIDPKAFASALNRQSTEQSESTLFTMSIGNINLESDVLTLCQAGAPLVYLLPGNPDMPMVQIGLGGLPVGYSPDTMFESGSYDLVPGDCLVGFSENFPEQETMELEARLKRVRGKDVKTIKAAVSEWSAEVDQTDDISALFLEYKPMRD